MTVDQKTKVCKISPIDEISFSDGIEAWFAQQKLIRGDSQFLLYQDDGLIWGRLFGDEVSGVIPSVSVNRTLLNENYFQQLIIFNHLQQITIWKDAQGFHGVNVQEESESGEEFCFFDQDILLWGTEADDVGEGFSYLKQGQQGITYIAPITLSKDSDLEPIMRVRNYVDFDPASGEAFVRLSRILQIVENGGK